MPHLTVPIQMYYCTNLVVCLKASIWKCLGIWEAAMTTVHICVTHYRLKHFQNIQKINTANKAEMISWIVKGVADYFSANQLTVLLNYQGKCYSLVLSSLICFLLYSIFLDSDCQSHKTVLKSNYERLRNQFYNLLFKRPND